MPAIHKPGKRLIVNAPLEFIRKIASGHGRSSVIADLNVTPMVDMLSMLVIFLLVSFSATGELLTVNKDIVLPKAFNAVSLERAPFIAISNKAVSLEGQFVMDASSINETQYNDWKLTPLQTRLELIRDQWKATHPGEQFDGQIIIQSDNSVPFSVIKMIMMTCAQADYTGMNFAVQQTDRKNSAVGE